MKVTLDSRKTKAQTRNQSRASHRKEARNEPLVFVGIDTEGSGAGTDHRPVLISCGTAYLSDPDGLDWERVFSFLYDQFRVGGYVYGGFYLSYDFTQWLRSLPEERAAMLLTARGRAKRKRRSLEGEFYFPVYLGDWEIDILGMRRLKIRPKGESRWMYICDTGPFFQCSFMKAINPAKWTDPIVTDEEYQRVGKGKELRSEAILDADMIEYQQLEVEIWSRLMDALQVGLRAIGVHLTPRQWFGPGQVAQAWLKTTDAPTGKELQAIDNIGPYLEAARKTYFGGWFEIFAHGHIPGVSFEYDINSAYPYIIASLPCLRHGRYSHGSDKPPRRDGSLCIMRGTAWSYIPGGEDIDDHRVFRIGAMLHRDSHGRIFRPIGSQGYFWSHEIEAAERAGCVVQFECHEWWMYEPCDCPPPLASIAELYYKRMEVGKNTILGKSIRLLINSVYGKFAQSVGMPQFGNPVYASLITAGCRTMILDAIATHPGGKDDVLMVATDGVYFLHRHPGLSLSSALGDWEESEHKNMCLFKPGMYWNDASRARIAAGGTPEFKARGINARDFAPLIARVDEIFAAWPGTNKDGSNNDMTYRPQWKRKGSGWPSVEFRAGFSMISATQAIQEGWDWSRAGEVSDEVILKQNAWHGQKRQGLWFDPEARIYRSAPRDSLWIWAHGLAPASVPYDKRFGLEDPWSDESEERHGITPDGPVGLMIGDVMFGSQ